MGGSEEIGRKWDHIIDQTEFIDDPSSREFYQKIITECSETSAEITEGYLDAATEAQMRMNIKHRAEMNLLFESLGIEPEYE